MSGTTNDSKTPEIKCCFELINAFPEKQDDLLADLSSVLANPLPVVPIENGFMCELSKTAYVKSWEVSDGLSIVLSDIRPVADELKKIAQKYGAQPLIDITFYHYGRYPSLIFEGEAMRLINYLDADISIDAY